jgi:hypothetical protein
MHISRHPHFQIYAEDSGIHLGSAIDYAPQESWLHPETFTKDQLAQFRQHNSRMALDAMLAADAQPTLITTPNAGIPAFLTTWVDPSIIKILLAPNKAADILGEVKKGSWVDQTAMFPIVERTGEVSVYGDWNQNGVAGINTDFPQRQSILYQTMLEYGELQMDRAGLVKISWAAEVKEAGIVALNKYQNFTYFFGQQGLQNYGLLTDPGLSAALTPALKAYGGTKWINNGVIAAQATEIYLDIQSMFIQLVIQTNGLVSAGDELVLAMSPQSAVALTATNSFGVDVFDLLKKNFPKIRFEQAVQYGATTTTNQQGTSNAPGLAGGNLVQMIAPKIEGQDAGYCAFNEKLRSHPVIRYESFFRQKLTQGSWGAIIRMPVAFVQMLGV